MPDLSIYYLFQAAVFMWYQRQSKRRLRDLQSREESDRVMIPLYPSQNGEA
jgi:hypothetical protein